MASKLAAWNGLVDDAEAKRSDRQSTDRRHRHAAEEEQGDGVIAVAAKLTGVETVEVQGASGPVSIKAKHILLATGSRPATMRGIEMDGKRDWR